MNGPSDGQHTKFAEIEHYKISFKRDQVVIDLGRRLDASDF